MASQTTHTLAAPSTQQQVAGNTARQLTNWHFLHYDPTTRTAPKFHDYDYDHDQSAPPNPPPRPPQTGAARPPPQTRKHNHAGAHYDRLAHLSCDSGEMILRLNFSEAFKGIVYPDHNRLSPCRFFGDGHHNYELRLPLRGCGTRQVSAICERRAASGPLPAPGG